MIIDSLLLRLESYASMGYTAISHKDKDSSYQQLIELISAYRRLLVTEYGSIRTIIVYGDFCDNAIAMFWAALLEKKIVLPLNKTLLKLVDIIILSQADLIYNAYTNEFILTNHNTGLNEGTAKILQEGHPGIIILSSGTTGRPKAVLHDAEKLLQKYQFSKKGFTTLAVMLFDHIAGIDTMLYTLAAGGTLVVPEDLNPEGIIKTAIIKEVEVLPVSPSLIRLMLMDSRFSPSVIPSLKIITFGSEYMTENTKHNLLERFSGKVRIIQKYGITEIGNPATETKDDDPSYIKFKDNLIEYKVLEGVLWIKSPSSMIGYLYQDHYEAFDGWFNTQDKVEVRGDWIKILGRVTDIINVGGKKVYPAEIESVLQSMDNVKEVTVYGKENPLMGSVVAARVCLSTTEGASNFKRRMRTFCKDRIDTYKIPALIDIVDDIAISDRFKKVR